MRLCKRILPCEEGFATNKPADQVDPMCRAVVEEQLVQFVDVGVLLGRDLWRPEGSLESRLFDRGWHQRLHLAPSDWV